ncbi:MAG: glycosyltransferase, partial [Bacillota bacterium]
MSIKICFLSCKHSITDNRIFEKEAVALAEAGFHVIHLAPGDGLSRVSKGVLLATYPKKSGCGILSRIKNLYHLFYRAIKIDADCYHCNEIESWLIGCFIKFLKPHKFIVFDVHEHYPSRFSEPHVPAWARIFQPVLFCLFKALPYWTDHLIFAKKTVANDFPRRHGRWSYIFNYAPLRFELPTMRDVPDEIRRLFGQGPTAIHIGSISRARGWPQLLEALANVQNQDLKVICLGEVDEGEETLMKEARRLHVSDRVHIRSAVPYEDMFRYLLCADIGLMLYQPGILNHTYAFPIKLYDYMLLGLPVIGPDFAVEVNPVVRKTCCGLLINTAN